MSNLMGDVANTTNDGTVDHRGRPASKKKTGHWKASRLILGNEGCERLAFYGMSANLVVYMMTQLNFTKADAAKSASTWAGTCYLTPLIGAFLADAYLGRFKTIAGFSFIYVIGMVMLTLSATVNGLKPACDGQECHPTKSQVAFIFASLYMVALGTGGIKPCVSSFGADQFDETDADEKKTKSSFFNWFYMSINVGALIASSALVWIQMNKGWGWGFGIPAAAMVLAIVFFFAGTKLYRYQKPGGSPFTRIFQVVVASFRKFSVKTPSDGTQLFETSDEMSVIRGSTKLAHTDKLRFFDKAATQTEADNVNGGVSAWKLCTVTQVEELKAVLGLLPVWACTIIFAAVYAQMSTMFVLQGTSMNQSVGKFRVPAASLSLFDTISVIIWIPLYDKVIVKIAKKFTGNERGFTQLQRMGIGLVISIFSMVVAGILEVIRLDYVRKNNAYDVKEVPISILWQIPQYFIIGCAEVFTFVGAIEFFYLQAPDAMRSLCSALALTANAAGSYLCAFIISLVVSITTRNGQLGWLPENSNRGHLDYFFWLLAILSGVNFLVYLVIAKCFIYKKIAGKEDE